MNVCRAFVTGLLCLALSACQTTTTKIKPSPPPLQTTVHVNGATTPGRAVPKTSDVTFAPDSCASRLQDIEGAMLQYWLINRQLPPRLEDLQNLADTGEPLKLTCGHSKQPFTYVRSGLRSPGRKMVIFVYDPTPASDGTYWCILGEPPRFGSSLTLQVDPVLPTLFRTYQPINTGG